jgi:hypothetical protein
MNTTNHTSPSGEDPANGAIGEREAFEAWYLHDMPHETYLLKRSHRHPDMYDDDSVEDAWTAWQARAALTAEKVAAQGQSWLPVISREFLGRVVREAWVKWAQQQPNPKPSWLAPYDELSEADKEADRQIGEAVTQWVLSIKSATWEVTAEKVAAEPDKQPDQSNS